MPAAALLPLSAVQPFAFSPRTHLQIVHLLSPLGRIVVTGSGLVSLLNSFRTTRVNGFALWDAVSFLAVGCEPSLAAAQSIAAAIFSPLTMAWPPAAKLAITPTTLIDALTSTAHCHLTSLRPALLAYTLGCMGDAQTGPPQKVLGAAVGAALSKLRNESTRDTLATLVALDLDQRRVLREVAVGGYTVAELEAIQTGMGYVHFKGANVGVMPEKLADLITCLREKGEGGDVVRLQPPYSVLLQSWVRTNGELAVAVHGDKIDLDLDTRTNLVFVADEVQRKAVSPSLRGAVSIALLESLARNCIGVRDAGGSVRPPQTPAEFDAVPALQALWDMLTFTHRSGSTKKQPTLSLALERAAKALEGIAAAPAGAAGVAPVVPAARFQETIGWELLMAFRHFHAHIWSDPAQLVRSGLTAAVVADAVTAAARVLADPARGCFILVGTRRLPKRRRLHPPPPPP